MMGIVGTILAIAGLMLVGTARAVETWDVEFTGDGDPSTLFPQSGNVTSSTYDFDDKFTTGDTTPGWLTVLNSAPGEGFLRRNFTISPPPNALTKAGGWTLQWSFLSDPTIPTFTDKEAINWSDDINVIVVHYDEDLVTIHNWTQAHEAVASVPVNVLAEHSYRLVRQAGSDTVELYIDESPTAATSLALIAPPEILNVVTWGQSGELPSAYDYFRWHSGATVPIPEPTTLALLGLGGLVLLGRWRRA